MEKKEDSINNFAKILIKVLNDINGERTMDAYAVFNVLERIYFDKLSEINKSEAMQMKSDLFTSGIFESVKKTMDEDIVDTVDKSGEVK